MAPSHTTISPTSADSRFPLWVIVGAVLLAAGYLPTLLAPFDFVDDGNLVYPTPDLSAAGHVSAWWERVAANVEHLGPFRPVVWAHWQITANLLGADPLAWRISRLLWSALAAGCLLWLLRELRVGPTAALVVAAAAMWNPSRNDIWTSLTLAEGVAMPYALLALIAARKAPTSTRPWRWDLLAVVSLLLALGCKNIFVALLPAMVFLRLFPDSRPLREGWQSHRHRVLLYLLPVLMPAVHFVYFKTHPGPCHYETPGPSWEQAGRFLSWWKGAAGLDYLGAGIGVVLAVLVWRRFDLRRSLAENRGAAAAAVLLFLAGFLVYLPVSIMTGRYTMPAVWGTDILFGLMLTAVGGWSWRPKLAWSVVAVGLVLMTIANVSRQEKLAARSRMLWATLNHVEATARCGSVIGWVGGSSERGELNVEEGIHFAWHLLHRGRGDLRIALQDADGNPVTRVELPAVTENLDYRLTGQPAQEPDGWQTERVFSTGYHQGRRSHGCRLESAILEPSTLPKLPDQILTPAPRSTDFQPSVLDPALMRLMSESFGRPQGHHDALDRLIGRPRGVSGQAGTAELLGSTAVPSQK